MECMPTTGHIHSGRSLRNQTYQLERDIRKRGKGHMGHGNGAELT